MYLFRILTSRLYVIITRLSYCVYLVQYTVFNYNVGTNRGTQHFGFFKSVVSFVHNDPWDTIKNIITFNHFSLTSQNIYVYLPWRLFSHCSSIFLLETSRKFYSIQSQWNLKWKSISTKMKRWIVRKRKRPIKIDNEFMKN